MGVPKFQQDIMRKYGLSPTSHSSVCMRTAMTGNDRYWLGLHNHSPEMVEAAENVAMLMTLDAQAACREEFSHLGISSEWEVVCHVDWSRNRVRSRGGRYSSRTRSFESAVARPVGARISLALGHMVPEVSLDLGHEVLLLKEYDHIAEDPEIGSFTGSWEDRVRVLVLHEVAHGVQFTISHMAAGAAGYPLGERGAHGKLWQDLYRTLRKRFGPTSAAVKEAPLRLAAGPAQPTKED